MPRDDRVHVVVHYIAAEEPFTDKEADPAETLGQLKARVLTAMGLSEGQTQENTTVTYTFYHDKTVLESMGETLGQLSGGHPVLQLKLSQQVTQGA